MSKRKILDTISIILIVVSILAAIFFYEALPSQVITHWNFGGQPDGWDSKDSFVILMPAITLAIYLLFRFLPHIDPKKSNYEKFSLEYKMIQLLIVAFLTILFFVSIFANLGYNLQVGIIVPVMVGILFVFFGGYIKNIKPNWFVGIRTPWTLSSEKVWIKTHELGSKMFMVSGVIFAIMPFLPAYLAIPLLIIAILLILYTILYSYLEFRKG